ncbi:RNA polymerase sigma factor [Dysgonomonas sp. 25]|uniref:RNA polymerase sigma factor n=1 Tax=Dysgonomonas sp. 25 TaxID=2302933 RepID=UPI0013D01892|nr:sigma-70 family RNA polymerase sigma factor [Dysgonomonas sp. 25]NDV68158.1 sigma-70 family RNA polymerase sigma factor [Dysgonomonas sp. 25]
MAFFSLNRKSNVKNLDDDQLLSLLRETGDVSHFNELYERYIPLVYGLCLKYLQDTEKAQDAVIDIFETLSPKITTYEIKVFKNWIYSVAKNHCFHILRENKKEIVVDFDSQIMESDTVLDLFSEETPDKDKEAALRECLNRLPDPQRTTIRMFFYEEKSYADIADDTGFNLKSVKSFLQNGKRNLKICVEKKLNL